MAPGAPPAFVITLSGSDASGSAGLQADNRAIRALGAFPLNVVTALTLQTRGGVQSVEPTPPELVRMHLLGLLNNFSVDVIKAGMLGSASTVEVLDEILGQYPTIRLVLDPVVKSTGGRPLLDKRGVGLLFETVLPKTFLITPNLPELAQLTGRKSVDSDHDEADAVRQLLQTGCSAALVKGGHRSGDRVEDRLYVADQVTSFSAQRIITPNTRGTGCGLASLIAAGLAQKLGLEESINQAKIRLTESLDSHADEKWPDAGPSFY